MHLSPQLDLCNEQLSDLSPQGQPLLSSVLCCIPLRRGRRSCALTRSTDWWSVCYPCVIADLQDKMEEDEQVSEAYDREGISDEPCMQTFSRGSVLYVFWVKTLKTVYGLWADVQILRGTPGLCKFTLLYESCWLSHYNVCLASFILPIICAMRYFSKNTY